MGVVGIVQAVILEQEEKTCVLLCSAKLPKHVTFSVRIYEHTFYVSYCSKIMFLSGSFLSGKKRRVDLGMNRDIERKLPNRVF